MNAGLQQIFFPNDHHPAHIRALDGLRGFAVLLVMMSHASLEGLNPLPFIQMMGAGKGGVMLFFVLSAYLLDRQITQALQQRQASTRYWANYALRRFLRIFPLFTLALVVYWHLSTLGYSTEIDSRTTLVQHLFLQRGESIFWSIPVEFKYYLISPLILWGCQLAFNWQYPATARLLWGLLVFSVVIATAIPWSPISTLKYLPIFFLGTLAAVFQLGKPEQVASYFREKRTTIITLLTLLFAYIILPHPLESLFGLQAKAHNAVGYGIWAFIGARLVLAVQYVKDVFKRIFEWNLLRWIGNISFSAYLFHLPILEWVLRQGSIPEFLKLPAFLLVTLLASSTTFALVERPLSRVRLAKQRGNNSSPTA